MEKLRKTGIALIMTLFLFLSALPVQAQENSGFSCLEYPAEAVTAFTSEKLCRISSGDDYLANRGYAETSLYLSPYWRLSVNGIAVPMYATSVYDWVLDTGVLQSFQYIFADAGAQLRATLSFTLGDIRDVTVLPLSLGAKAQISGNTLRLDISQMGTYTCLINGDSQAYAVTLFVRENMDEQAQIAQYCAQYGADRVAVYEKGLYAPDSLPTDKDVLYFKRGAFVSFAHQNDIRSDADAEKSQLPPVLDIYDREGFVLAGCGTFDCTRLDRRERGVVNMSACRDSVLEGMILLNPNSWTVTAYACEGCTLRDITVFGYRTNSDGINICGCRDVTVADSFCRNGDDCFSVKTTNTYYECHDVTFTGCIGWSCKARCFGVTGEVERDIYRVTFSDCAVIFRNAVWNLDRTASLAVAVETGKGDVRDILFENIEIYRDTGRPIYCMVYGDDISDCTVENVVFRNITICADQKIKLSSQRNIGSFGKFCAAADRFLQKIGAGDSLLCRFFRRFYQASNSVSVCFENVSMNGRALTDSRKDFVKDGNVRLSVCA